MSDRRKNPDSREKIVDLPLPALSALQLARMILSAPVPEHIISCLPAQSLYMAVQALGLESAREIIEAASDEQYRLLLDLHLWDKDSFNEENFWDWLSVIDDPDSFDSLQHFQECLDPRLTALVIQRNVAVQVNEEPTEVPPGAGWYTPDKGYTWLRILCTEAEEHRLLGRFLALLFDQNPELFYQLIALPQAATAIELEEEAYAEQRTRFAYEGIPEFDAAAGLNQPIPPDRVVQAAAETRAPVFEYSPVIQPVIYDPNRIEPLYSLAEALVRSDELDALDNFQRELSLLANAAIIFYGVAFHEEKQAAELIEKVRGAVNVGLETVLERRPADLADLYKSLGLTRIYKIGLGVLHELRQAALSIPEQMLSAAMDDQAAFSIAASARERFPVLPCFFQRDGSFRAVEGTLESGHRAFTVQDEVKAVFSFLRSRFGI